MQKELINSFIDDTDFSEKTNLSLSINYNNTSFGVVVIDTTEQLIVLANTYRVKKNTPDECIQEIIALLESSRLNINLFSKIVVSTYNKNTTLIPDLNFDSIKVEKCFNYCFGSADIEYQITSTKLKNFPVSVISQSNIIWNGLIERHFPKIAIITNSTALVIDAIQKEYSVYDFSKSIFVNFYSDSFEVIHIKADMINFYNTYNYSNKEDVIYYLAVIAKELGLDFDSTELILSGDFVANHEWLAYFKKYIRKVNFFSANTSRFTERMPIELRHYYTSSLNI